MLADEFQTAILAWFQRYGRKNLPWQLDRSPYGVWISEIMLQQTQVATVIPYFERFMKRLPTARALADASLETVIELWAGLGYYARAHNLHKAAQAVQDVHGGELPADLEALQALPGIGRSTAGAVLSLGFGLPAPILDGNVKRVLARFAGLEGWPGQPAVQRELWRLSEAYTPTEQTAAYNQAMMDLGATVCLARRPLCGICPLASACVARATDKIPLIPAPKPRQTLSVRKCLMLVLRDGNGAVRLELRPPTGIWGGLWSLPEFENEERLKGWCLEQGIRDFRLERLPEQRHTFSHFHLDFVPVLVKTGGRPARLGEPDLERWSLPEEAIGLPGPIKRLLSDLAKL